jgi:hypothetical protein
MKQLGIDPATFRFVAQCLNHYAISNVSLGCVLLMSNIIQDYYKGNRHFQCPIETKLLTI